MASVVAIVTLDTKGAEYVFLPERVLERTMGVAGFFGASSMDRLLTEIAITETVRRFKQLRPSPGSGS